MEDATRGPSREASGASVEEAVASAARELGLQPEDVDVEVLEQPRRGVFSRRSARVRVTARAQGSRRAGDEGGTPAGPNMDSPAEGEEVGTDRDAEAITGHDAAAHTSPASPSSHSRPNQEDPVTDTTADEAPEQSPEEELSPEERLDQLDEEAEIAADFLEGLLDILSLPGDIEIVVREEQALVNINEVGSGLLIGRRGATLDALQELVRCATQRRTERRAHVRVDVEGYRERQLEKLREKCRDAIAEVREHGEPVRLDPMDPYERKMMHDVVAKASGVTSTSEGNEPRRRVVIHPAES